MTLPSGLSGNADRHGKGSAASRLRADASVDLSPGSDGGRCDNTAAYLFLTGDRMDLVDTWNQYFSTCDPDVFNVHIHAQGAVPPLANAKPVAEPVMGELRFSWNMIDAENRLYWSALSSQVTNGCTPRWLLLFSADSAPLQPCGRVHEKLAASAGTSMVESITCPEGSAFCADFRLDWWDSPWLKQSQWHALWADHARTLLKEDQTAWRGQWIESMRMGAPDEFYPVNTMARLGLPMSRHGLVYVVGFEPISGHSVEIMCDTVDIKRIFPQADEGRIAPDLAEDELAAVTRFAAVVEAAEADGKFFARKFARSCSPMLLQLIMERSQRLTQMQKQDREVSVKRQQQAALAAIGRDLYMNRLEDQPNALPAGRHLAHLLHRLAMRSHAAARAI